ncbi:hypothetical protein L226DRAFT_533837 [Lentinus tigrinus ALCF2SS1-7]|uniref:uncharacterized protein n=1 Tax=Lentinus tigrinus ALCF2SS1-7 TaxID=1328758 RepID=UPI001165DF61|nr:hypothetical protein L226DRAFT_533837 [Lentinus tigrinus ALCF2SS1-7]
MTIIKFKGAPVDQIDDAETGLSYSENWVHHTDSQGDHENTVSETSVVGDTVNLTFTGKWVSVYGDRSPSGTAQSTYAIDGALPFLFSEERVFSLKSHNVQFFNSSSLLPGTHTLVVTNIGSSLFIDYFLVGQGDDVIEPQTSSLTQSNPSAQATSILTSTTGTVLAFPSTSGFNGSIVSYSSVQVSSTPAASVSAQGAPTPSSSYSTSLASSHSLTVYAAPTASPSSESSSRRSGNLSKGASAGLAVGISVVSLLVIGGIVTWCYVSRRRRRRDRTELTSVPAVVVTESPSLEPIPSAHEKDARRFSDIGTSVFSLPPYGYTSHDPQVPTRSDIDDGLVPYNGLIDSKPPLPLSPLRRLSTSSATHPLSQLEDHKREDDRMPSLAPLRGRWE